MNINDLKKEQPQLSKLSDDVIAETYYRKKVLPVEENPVDFDTFKAQFLGQPVPTTPKATLVENPDNFLGEMTQAYLRGLDEPRKGLQYLNPFGSDEDVLKGVTERVQQQRQRTPTEYEREFMDTVETGTVGQVLEEVVTNPKGTASAISSSLGFMTPAALASGGTAIALETIPYVRKLPRVAKRAITGGVLGLSSGTTEGVSTLLGSIEEFGYDIGNEEQLSEALKNPVIMEYAKDKAVKRGVSIGAFDAISGGLAGALVKPGAEIGEQALRFVGETGVQASAGMGGEATAQIATEGEITQPGAIALEGILEGVMAVPQAATMAAIEGKEIISPSAERVLGKFKSKAPEEIEQSVQALDNEFQEYQGGELTEELEAQLFRKPQEVDVLETPTVETPTIQAIREQEETLSTPVSSVNIPEGLNLQYKDPRLQTPVESIKTSSEYKTAMEQALDNEGLTPLMSTPGFDLVKEIIPPSAMPKEVRKKKLDKIKPPKIFDTQGNPYDVEFQGVDEATGVKLAKLENGQIVRVEDSYSEVSPKDKKNYVLQSPNLEVEKFNPYENPTKAKEVLPFIDEEISNLVQKGETNRTPIEQSRLRTLQRDRTALAQATKPKRASKTPQPVKPIESKSQKANKTIYPPRTMRLYTSPVKVQPEWETTNKTGGQNIFRMPLTPNGEARYSQLKPLLERELSNIAGDVVKLDLAGFLASEVDDPELMSQGDKAKAEFLRGVQIGNVVHIALEINDSNKLSQMETLLHEAYHILKDEFDVLSSTDKKILERAQPEIRKTLVNSFGMEDTDLVLMQEMAGSELEATLFGMMMSGDTSVKLPPLVQRVFNKIKTFLTRLGNGLRGLGFRSYQDIFKDIKEGEFKDSISVMENVAEQKQIARLQKYTALYKDKQAQHARDLIDKDIQINPNVFRDKNAYKDFLGFWEKIGLKMGTGAMVARVGGKPFAQLTEMLKAKNILRSTLNKDYVNKLEGVLGMSPGMSRAQKAKERALFEKVTPLIDYMKRTQQSYVQNEQGNYIYKAQDGTIREIGVEESRKINEIRNLFDSMLIDMGRAQRSLLGSFGIDPKISLNELQTIIDTNPDKLTGRQIESLRRLRTQLEEIDTVIGLQKAYVPWMRDGNVAISVISKTEKDEKTGKPKLVHLETFEDPTFGLVQSLSKDVKSKQQELQERYGSDYVVSKPFRMTYNEIERQLGSEFITMEYLSSVLSSERIGQYEELMKSILSEVDHKGLLKHFLAPRKIEGYSQQWDKVFVDFMTGAVQNIVDTKYTGIENQVLSAMELNQPVDGSLKKALNSYIEYNFKSPENDMAAVRQLNYYFAMGGNISTAFLNWMTSFTAVPGFLTLSNYNMPMNFITASKALSDAIRYFPTPEKVLDDVYMDKIVAKGIISQDLKEGLQRAARDGFLQPSLAEDYLGKEIAGYRMSGIKGKTTKGLQRLLELSSAPLKYTENNARIATFLATYRTIDKNESNLANLFKNLEKEPRWKAFYEINKETNDMNEMKILMSEFSVDFIQGLYGKEGRGYFQRGIWGSLLVPFATFPQNQMEMQLTMFRTMGPEGKAAALYTAGLYVMLAGAAGIPMWEFLQKLYDMYSRIFNMKPAELEKDLQDLLVKDMGLDPELAQSMVNGGSFRMLTSLDMGDRLGGASIPLLDFAMGVTYGEDIRDMTGVVGSAVKPLTQMAQGESVAGQAPNLLPVALRNYYKAAIAKTDGLSSSTSAKTRYLNPEELTYFDTFKLALGFKPEVLGERQRMVYYAGFEARQASTGKTYFVNKEVEIREDLRDAVRNNETEKVQNLREKLREHKNELRSWAKEHDPSYPSSDWWKGYQRSIESRIQQRRNPDRPARVRSFQNQRELGELYAPSLSNREERE